MKLRSDDEEYYTKQGEYFGYPKCCIKSFIKTEGAVKNPQGKEASKLNGKNTGFIPCKYHAKKILSGEITLESLIATSRKEKLVFPNSDVMTNPYISDEIKDNYKKYVTKK